MKSRTLAEMLTQKIISSNACEARLQMFFTGVNKLWRLYFLCEIMKKENIQKNIKSYITIDFHDNDVYFSLALLSNQPTGDLI